MNYTARPFNEIRRYRKAASFLGTLLLSLGTPGAIGLAWLNQELARSAQECSRLERAIEQQERDLASMQARISRFTSPEHLKTLIPSQLRPTTADQVVWMRMPSADLDKQTVADASSPLKVSFELALFRVESGVSDD